MMTAESGSNRLIPPMKPMGVSTIRVLVRSPVNNQKCTSHAYLPLSLPPSFPSFLLSLLPPSKTDTAK